MSPLTTTPSRETIIPQYLFTGVAALLLGALDPNIQQHVGRTVGHSNYRVDPNGDALASAVLPEDRWRIAHNYFQQLIYTDAKVLGLQIRKEVSGLFSMFYSQRGLDEFNNANERTKRTIGIIPDLVTYNPSEGSPIYSNGPQMWELKRVHSVQAFSRTTGLATGLNKYYKENRGEIFKSAANKREDEIPGEYENKAKYFDVNLGEPDSTKVQDALKRYPQVKGLAIGAFGEFSDTINLLIDGLAYEGSIRTPHKFGQSNPAYARSIIKNWLRRRWSRASAISAAQTRYDAIRYVGGFAQQQTAANHERAERDEEGRQHREREVRDRNYY